MRYRSGYAGNRLLERTTFCQSVSFSGFLLVNFFLFFHHIDLYGQQKQITGTIKNSQDLGVAYANVMLENANGYIIKFVTTNSSGKYQLVVPDSISFSSLFIEISHLGYKRVQQPLIASKLDYDFLLQEQSIDLKEVMVRDQPKIISIGDTLSYDVASFSRPEDRSIGDVIRRLPGITVSESGQISYNGKAITNLFIHGDDLMDGRYGLATKVISKDMIKSVDVLQHHQPIKVLKNKVFTDDVAMNLVLKDENSVKLAGQAMLGAGLPEQFDAAINTMLFNRKFKMLNAIQTNNSGVDYQNDFAQLGNAGLVSNVSGKNPSALLSAATTGSPNIPKRNYYLNRSGLVNLNNLLNLKGGLQLKTNFQAFTDRSRINFNNQLNNFLQNDTIVFNESQRTVSKPYEVRLATTATVNKESYFLNNKSSFNFIGADKESSISFNGNSFNQLLADKTFNFTNDLNYIPALKNKNLIELRWLTSYHNNPQQLSINQGINQEILNGNIPYAAAQQYAQTPTFSSHATLSYRILNTGQIKQNYLFGLLNERQQLKSNLSLTQLNGATTSYLNDVGNDLSWSRDRLFFDAQYFLKKEKWEATLAIPLIAQHIGYKQQAYNLDAKNNQIFANPTASVKLFVNAEDYLSANYSFNNDVGVIADVYRGVILSNYRSVNANLAPLQEQYSSGAKLFYNFRRSIVMLFVNAGINYRKVTVNSITSSTLTDRVQRSILLPFKNDQSVFSADAEISKFLFALNSTVSLKSSWNSARYNQFINNTLLPFNNNSLNVTAGIRSKIFGITLDYSGLGLWSASRQIASSGLTTVISNTVERFDQNLDIGYMPINGLFVNIAGRHIYASQANAAVIKYLFLDARIRYKILKWRTDLDLDLTNFTNIRAYEIFSLTSNQLALSSYEIRGRMAIIRATFNL